MAKTVKDVMAENPQSVEPSDSVADAAKKLKEADIGALLVTDGDELKGIVTDRDIVVGAVAEGKDPDDAKVEEVATTDVTTIEADADLEAAVKQMREADVRRLPVVEDDKPVGIVSLGDLAIALDDDSALADISASSPNN
jgi:CBS domain-containing protein